jgi:dolichyl-phosphate-mannose--protein O-mannosyl transferase
VVALALIVQLLFASALWTFVGGLLLATESLNFVQSRTAMLDIFVAFWIVLGFLLLLMDRRWIDRRAAATASEPTDDGADPSPAARPPRVPAPLWRPWRFAAGAALGAGLATKWSALTAIAAVLLMSVLWEVTRRRRAGVRGPVVDTLMAEGFGIVLALIVAPIVVYVAAYLPWFGHFGWSIGDWWRLQNDIWEYHQNLRTIDEATGEPVHAYLSEAWRWIFLWRPVLYYADYHEGFRQVIYANGNPAIFWASILAVPYAAFAWATRRDWRAGFAFVAVAGLYVPWLLVPRPQFLFYATPISAFLVLAIVLGLRDLSEVRYEPLRPAGTAARAVRPYLPVAVGFVVVSVGLFVWFWPVLTGGPVSDHGWALRAWFPSWV